MDEIYFNFISLGFGTSSRIGSGLYQKGQDPTGSAKPMKNMSILLA
jgi:hypothetical protein